MNWFQYTPTVVLFTVGYAVLVRYHGRSRLGTTLGLVGLSGLAVFFFANIFTFRMVAGLIDSLIPDKEVAVRVSVFLHGFVFTASQLCLVAGIVVDRRPRTEAGHDPDG